MKPRASTHRPRETGGGEPQVVDLSSVPMTDGGECACEKCRAVWALRHPVVVKPGVKRRRM